MELLCLSVSVCPGFVQKIPSEPFVSRHDVHECVLCEKSGMYGHGHSKGLLLIRVYDCFYHLVF